MAKARNTARPRQLLNRPRAPDLPQPERVRTKGGATTDEPIVVDCLAKAIPVTAHELDVIETYLGHLIDRLLIDAVSDRTATPSTFNPGTPIRAPRPRS